MALLQRTRILPQQRLDLPDFRNIEDFVCADFKAQFKNTWSNENFVLSGFEATGTGNTELEIAIAGSVLLIGADDGTMFIGAPSISAEVTDALTPASTNYVEISIEQDTGGADSRAFWDQTAAGGAGGEFSQIVDTFIFTKIKLNISTSNFSGSPDKVAICEVDVNGSGVITAIRDARNMYWRLGRTGDDTYSFPWASRTEPPVTQFNGADKDIKNQKQFNDAVMSRIKELSGTTYWYEDSGVSTVGVFRNAAMSITTAVAADAKWSWDGSNLRLTDNSGTPLDADAIAALRLFDSVSNLILTRQDGQGGSSAFALADGDVLWVKLPEPLASVNYDAIGLTASNFRISPRGSVPLDDSTYWLAYREGANVYLRSFGELQPNEEVEISDNVNENILAAIGIPTETSMPVYISTNFVTSGTSLVTAVSALDQALGLSNIASNQDRSLKLIEGGIWNYEETVGGSTPTVIATNSAIQDSFYSIDTASKLIAQSFTPSSSVDATDIMVHLRKAGSPVFDARITIYPDLAGEPNMLLPLGTTNLVAAASLPTDFTTQTTFTLTAPVSLTSGQKYWFVINPQNISVITGGDHIQSWYRALSGLAGEGSATSNNNGGIWTLNPAGSDLNFSVNGQITLVGSNLLSWSEDAFIDLPEVTRVSNRILAGNVSLPNANSVAYVSINRASGPNTLTVNVGDIDALTIDENTVVIARRVSDGVIVGTSSFLLKAGEYLELDGALAELNRYMDQLKLKSHESDLNKVRINGASTNLLNGAILNQPIGNFLLNFSGAVINFTTGVITEEDEVTALGNNFTPFSIPVGEYFWYGISLVPGNVNSDNTQFATVQVDLASASAAIPANAPKPVMSGDIKLGAILVRNNAGSIQVSEVRRLGVGTGSGSGSGQGASFDAEFRSYLKLSPYEFGTQNIIAVDGDDLIDNASTGAYNPANKTFELLTGQNLISEELLDADFISANRPLAKARVLLRYAEGAIDANPTVELQKNGGSFQAVTMTRIGNTDTFEGELDLSSANGTSLILRVTASADSEVFAYGVMYDTTFVAIPLGLAKNVHTETFSGDDNLTTFTLPFIPDYRSLQVFDKRRGQVYVWSPNNVSFTISGNDVVFAANFFDYPGETVELEFRQLEGNGFDNSDQNATAIAELLANAASIGSQLNGQRNFVALNKIAAPFTTIENRALIPDFTLDLAPRMGVERIQFQELYDLTQEFGPNGEVVKAVTNDKFNRIRFVGQNWVFFVGTAGEGAGVLTSNLTEYVEVTFYGTGLNILTNVDIASRDLRASVDGGAEGSNLVFNGSNVLTGRFYNTNAAMPVVSGLTPGIHTVRIRSNNAAGIGIYGVEILNETSQIFVNPGVYLNKGKQYQLGARTGTSFNSGFDSGTLGTKGGCVSLYLKEDGTLGKAVNPTDATIQYLSSANHSNEQIVRKYNFREFGKGRADDFSIIQTFSNDNRAFTGEDGTTSLTGQNSGVFDVISGSLNGLGWGNSTAEYVITFIGTGLDIVDATQALTGANLNIFVDEVSAGTIAQTVGIKKRKIVSGLPYGTHTVRLQAGSPAPTDWVFQEIIVYAPKKPSIPSTAVELSNHFVMANFAQGNSVGNVLDSTGVIHKAPGREFIYGGTWTVNGLNPALVVGGLDIRTTTNGSFFEHTFYGTGFSLPIRANAGTANITLTLDGSTDFTSRTVVQTATGTFTPGTGTYTGAINDGHIGVTGLTYGRHTLRVTFNNAAAALYFAPGLQVITPIHTPSIVGQIVQQDAMDVGSMSLNDLRQFSDKEVYRTEDTWYSRSFAPIQAANLGVYYPSHMKATIYMEEDGEVEYSLDGRIIVNNLNAILEVRTRLDGVYTDAILQARANSANNLTQSVGLVRRLRLSKGFHTLQVWVANIDTLAVTKQFENAFLKVRKVTK